MQLQNLLYERNSLQREIEQCRRFPARELSQITADEGASPLSEDVEAGALLTAEQHQENLKRLQTQLQVRETLQEQLRVKQIQLDALTTTNAQRRTWLSGLPAQVKQVEAAAAPLNKYLPTAKAAHRKLQHRAAALPTPLYVVFSQLEAVRDHFGECSAAKHASFINMQSMRTLHVPTTSNAAVTSLIYILTVSLTNCPANAQSNTAGDKLGIAVDIVPAIQYSNIAAAATSSQLATAAAAKTAPAADAGTKRRKHHHPDTAATTTAAAVSAASEPELLALVRSSRQLRAPADSTATAAAAAATVSAAEALKCAPEAVQLRLRLGTADGPFKQGTEVTLQLQYLPALGLVAVAAGGAHAPAHLLTNLFPGDSGAVSPNLSNAHSVAAAAAAGATGSSSSSSLPAAMTFQYPEALPARPYRWAQWLCGLYYSAPAETGAAERAPLEPSTRAVLTRIRSRIVSRAVLEYQLQQVSSPLLSGAAIYIDFDACRVPCAAICASASVHMLQVEVKVCTAIKALRAALTA
jgi:Fms-interacting protein/Thoc5